jgi:hypothetical protein
MDDDRTETLIRQNHALLALAAAARTDAREAVARAADRIVTIRRAQITLARALFRLQHPRSDNNPSADAFFGC